MATSTESFRRAFGSDSGGLLAAVMLETHASGKRVKLQMVLIVESAELEASDGNSGDSVADSWDRAPMTRPMAKERTRRAEMAIRRRRL